jgi:D-amino-acid oxidase
MSFKVAVIGAGVAGLSSALKLKQDGHDVTVYDKDKRGTGATRAERSSGEVYHTRASLAAAGFWYPFHVNARDAKLAGTWAYDTFRRFEVLSKTVGTGIIRVVLDEWFETEDAYDKWKKAPSEKYWRDDIATFGFQRLSKDAVHEGFTCGIRMNTYVARMPDYLTYLRKQLNEPKLNEPKARLVTQEIKGIGESTLDNFDFVVNCTGFDAASLVGDDDVKPVIGHVIVSDWIEHESLYPRGATKESYPRIVFLTTGSYEHNYPFYLVPRGSKGDGNADIVVGGTYHEEIQEMQDDAWDRQQFAHIEATLRRLFPELSQKLGIADGSEKSKIHLVRGRRPFRMSGPRVGWGTVAGRPVIHNYGHGGGGITLSWGCAMDVARIASRFEGEGFHDAE